MSQKEGRVKLEGTCQGYKEVFNQAFMDTFIFGESLLVMDDEYNIRRVDPMSDEFMKLKQQEDEK